MSARYLIGDVFERLAEMPDGSVDLVLTSPPFLALRSYLPAEHPDKAKEIGSEPTPAAFLDTLLHLTAEWRRVLAPHGSIAVELGDTYSGSGGAGGDYGPVGLRAGQEAFDGSAARTRSNRPGQYGSDTGPPRRKITADWPMDKSLCGIPHLYHLSLAYGRNLLTGEPSPAGSWRVRNVVAWCRPNPPVGALGDKFRPGTSYMTIATVARDRYFDLDAVRTEAPRHDNQRAMSTQYQAPGQPERKTRASDDGGRIYANVNGAPPLDWWEIPTQPYAGSHYATWPEALLTRPIAAMCPQRVCLVCGEPSRRIVDTTYERSGGGTSGARRNLAEPDGRMNGTGMTGKPTMSKVTETTGWTDCGCGGDDADHWRNGIVLDPFAGSGTTLAVATGHGRDAIGIDLDARNADLARERVGMFLEVELPTAEGVA